MTIPPYEILDYQGTLVLEDPKGQKATFHRKQDIRFLQRGVKAILDHAWGDGELLSGYEPKTGVLQETIKDRGYVHLVVGLDTKQHRGDVMTFDASRTVSDGFTKDEEWLETRIDHGMGQLNQSIIFPKERPVKEATLYFDGWEMDLPALPLTGGRTFVMFYEPFAIPDIPYLIRWTW